MSTILKTLTVALLGLFLPLSVFAQSATPTPFSPNNRAVLLHGSVTLQWNITANAVSYHLQVDTTTSFTTPVYNNTSIPATLTPSQTLSGLPANKELYWRVRGFDNNNLTDWSPVYSFHQMNPRGIGDMQLWVRADHVNGTALNAGVTIWPDSSGKNVQIQQAADARKPVVKQATWLHNNSQVLFFDGTNDYLDGGQALELHRNDQTLLIVFNSLVAPAPPQIQTRLISKRGHGASNTDGWCLAPRNHEWNSSVIVESPAVVTIQGNADPHGINDTNYKIVSTVWKNATSEWWLYTNTQYKQKATATSGSLAGLDISNDLGKNMSIGCSYNTSADLNFFHKGNIAEIMVYHTALDSVTRMRAEQYLRHKYTPPVNLGRDIINHTLCPVQLNAAKPYFVPTQYRWYNLANPSVVIASTSTLNVTQPGTYVVTTKDTFFYTSSDTIRIDYPTPVLPGDTTICYGDTIKISSLLGSNYSYLWSNGATTEFINITQPGTYYVRMTYNGIGGCTLYSDTFRVAVDLFTRDATLGPDATFCPGNSLRLLAGAPGAVSYLWSDSSTGHELFLFDSDTYWVQVTDTSGCQITDTIVATVVPGILPEVDFVADSVCFGTVTTFTNASTIDTPATIASYLWEFGDNTTDTGTDPTHQYGAAGNYTVRLTVTSDIGCNSSLTKTVVVFATPNAAFSTTLGDSGCINTLYAFFDSSSTSTPPDVVSVWNWSFGDGDTSATQHPVHSYSTIGSYDITLEVETQHGCIASTTRTITMLDGIPDPKPFSVYSPAANTVISDDTITFMWNPADDVHHYRFELATDSNFTGGSIVFQQNTFGTEYTFPNITPGIYYWRVVALNICGTEVASDHFYPLTIFGNGLFPGMQLWLRADAGIVADSSGNYVAQWQDQSDNGYVLNQGTASKRPLRSTANSLNNKPVVLFPGVSTGAFLDGDDILNLNTNDQTLFVVFNSNANTDQARIIQKRGTGDAPGWCIAMNTQGRLTPSLIVRNTTDIIGLEAGTDYGLTNGCFRILNTIWDNSEGAWDLYLNGILREHNVEPGLANKSITTGRNLTLGCAWNSGTSQSQFFNGNMAEVIVFSTAMSNTERKIVTEYLRQKYYPPVNLGADIVKDYGFCDNIVLRASNCTACGAQACTYKWSTGETTQQIVAPGQGVYAVTVTDGFGFTSSDSVIVKGGFNTVSFSDTVSLCVGDTLRWDTKLGTDGYTFQWQDGNPNSFYNITLGGDYWVQVTDTNTPPCSYTSDVLTVLIDSFELTASLGPDTQSLCDGNRIALVDGAETAFQYLWSDGSTGTNLSVHNTDEYRVTAANRNLCLMEDTVYIDIRGVAPEADFAFNTTCLNDSTFFTDESVPQAGNNIVSWTWNFDDGSDIDSVQQHPEHLFAATGLYDVNLKVVDDNQCYQEITKTVEVLKLPTARFNRELVNCANDSVLFTDASIAPSGQSLANYAWTFGDGGTETAANPAHIFLTEGIYPVTLRVTTNAGCTDTTQTTMEIFPELKADIEATNFCHGDPVNFRDASPGNSTISWYWDFGNNSGVSTQKNPVYQYPLAGTYTVTLEIRNAIGCRRRTQEVISVTTKPTVNFTNPSVCDGSITFFEDNTVGNGNDQVVSREWKFGDGAVSYIQNPTHQYDSIGTYNVTLTVHTRNGCTNFATKPVTVVEPPAAGFTFTPDFGPAPLTVTFTNQSQDGTDYLWDFGDGETSSEISPVHTFLQNGPVLIKLITSNEAGCSDTVTAPLNVSFATLDLALDDIIIEKTFNTDCSYSIEMYARVINAGTRQVTSFDITANHSLGGTIQEHWEGTFPGLELPYNFHANFIIHDCSEDLVLCMEVKNPNGEDDEDPSNNYLCESLGGELEIIGPAPNPTGDFVNLQVITPVKGALAISNYNVVGQNFGDLQHGQVDKGLHQYKFDVAHLPQGMYVLKITFNEEERMIKFLKR